MRETVGLTVHLKDMNVMCQAVEERAGQAFLAEGAVPFIKRQVRCDDGGAALVALADQFEQ